MKTAEEFSPGRGFKFATASYVREAKPERIPARAIVEVL